MSGRELVYLLLDDHGGRNQQFKSHVSSAGLAIETAYEANELEAVKDDLASLDGAVIDFHLSTPTRRDYPHLHYPCIARDCPSLSENDGTSRQDIAEVHAMHDWHTTAAIPTVQVTTGLGAMLYVKQHAPNVPLFGFCELNAEHSLLFLLAAHVWLGASAINAQYAPEDIRDALLSSEPETCLPVHEQLMAASDGFRRLTDSLAFLDRRAESFDWLDEYRFCGHRNTLSEFKRRLRARFGRRTLESDIYIEVMCRWQGALARIMKAFNRDVSDWPDLRDVTSARHWDDHNPVLDFVQNADYRTFFTSPDVRAALTYYRADVERRRQDDLEY